MPPANRPRLCPLSGYPSSPILVFTHVVRRPPPRSASPHPPWAHPADRQRHIHPRWRPQGQSRRRPTIFWICRSFCSLFSWTTLNSLVFCVSTSYGLYGCQTLEIKRVRPRPPAPNSVVLGAVTRLSPLQAVVSITVVDGVPLPAGEEFTGVIRVQDVRATEKDKVKIADCFRGGDVVRGVVVCSTSLGEPTSLPNNWLP